LLEEVRGIQANLVDVDTVEGAKAAARHLVELGHTRLVHFAGPRYSLHSEERIAGMRAMYSESHLVFSDDLIVSAGDSLEAGYRTGLAYFRDRAANDRPTAVTCYNDLVALGLCRALNELGIRVPQDVSVVGFDDLKLIDYLSPAARLTTVSIPKFEVGRSAAEILHRDIESSEPTGNSKVYLHAQLVIRQTTTAPPSPR
jgi:LacI family transcriptional regulator/LacI family repressor for deo operon, udp, cdd, tsx, nupC, and nupG